MLKKLACTNKTYQNQAEKMHRSLCQDHIDVPPDIDLSSDSSDDESYAFILNYSFVHFCDIYYTVLKNGIIILSSKLLVSD